MCAQRSVENENNKDLIRLTFGCLYVASARLIWGQGHRTAQSSEVTSWGWYQTHRYLHLPWLWRNYCSASGDMESPPPLDNLPTHPEAPADKQTHTIKACTRTQSERIPHLSSPITSSCSLIPPAADNFPPMQPSELVRNSRNSQNTQWLYYWQV